MHDYETGSAEEAVAVRVQIYSGFRWPLSFANMTPMHTRGVRRIQEGCAQFADPKLKCGRVKV